MGQLDYELWKTSRMMAQGIPLQSLPEESSKSDDWVDFGPHWN